MKTILAAVCCVAALAGSAAAETLLIRDFVGRVEIVTGAYDRVDVEAIGGAAGDAPAVRRRGETVEVDGGRGRDFWNAVSCRQRDGVREVRLDRRGGFHPMSDLPLVRVTAPSDVTLKIEGSLVDGAAGAVGEARIALASCARLVVESVAGPAAASLAGGGVLTVGPIGDRLDASIAGSGMLTADEVAGPLNASIAGSGQANIGAARGGATLNIAGSGDLRLANAAGDVDASIAGSGDIRIADGDVGVLSLNIMGAGRLSYGGSARLARVSVSGSGDVDIAQADDSDVRVAGSGNVRINGVRVR